MAVALDEALAVVAAPERQEGKAQDLDGLEPFGPEELFLEGADEALGTPVALGLSGSLELYGARRSCEE